MSNESNRIVTVCAACLQASCWHGELMCDAAKRAGVVDKTVAELNALGLEHPSHYSRKKIEKVCGVGNVDRYAKETKRQRKSRLDSRRDGTLKPRAADSAWE